jgi:hypothetical protein
MKTGSLRARVILTTLAVLAIVLAGVVTAVTLAYRAKLDGDLHTRLARAGASVERARTGKATPTGPRARRDRHPHHASPREGDTAEHTGEVLDDPGARIIARPR